MLRHLLQGRPLGHPLHPMLVHLPIALFAVSLVLDAAEMFRASGTLVRPSYYAMAAGVVTALLAATAGLADYADIRRDHPGRRTATLHMILNLVVVALYAANLLLRRPHLDDARPSGVAFALSLLAIAVLSFSGYLGGRLVYDDGIGVGRHRRQQDAPRETIEPDARGAGDGEIIVADEADLHDGQTLRAEVNGVVMTIVKVGGQVYAVQEFCTHRYGPLSEGRLEPATDNGDGPRVICPWHGSCFDLKTGEACGGPAKEPVRAFDVVIRDGKVHVRVPEHPTRGDTHP
ncbi:MAG TPA: DUF2231 domain-containing protein [Tepidisphaeraceae bacterium]|nr:DUF2231 domain-containing protein [Tepidisphaeraceae bacterium]